MLRGAWAHAKPHLRLEVAIVAGCAVGAAIGEAFLKGYVDWATVMVGVASGGGGVLATALVFLIPEPAYTHNDQLRKITDLSEPIATKLGRFRNRKRDIEEQLDYLTSDRQGQNIAVTAGQTIIDNIDNGLFAESFFEDKLQTRVNALKSKSYQWQMEGPWSNLSVPYHVFLTYRSAKLQGPKDKLELEPNPDTQPTLQGIEQGVKWLVDDLKLAIAAMEEKLGD